MSLYQRLDRRLEAQADNAGPIRGSLSVLRICMIWLAADLVVTNLLTGTLLIPGVDFYTAFAMILLGTFAGAVVLTLVGNIGTRTGLPTMALTRGAFGTNGSLLPMTANVIILMGWSWVQAMLAGLTVDYLVQDLTGFSNPVLFCVLCQTLVVMIALLGHEGIARIEPWLAAFMLVIIAWIFVLVFMEFSPADFQSIPVDESIGLTSMGVLDIIIATAISWTVLAADFNRLARTSRVGITGSGIGYFLSTTIAITLGLTAFGYVILKGDEAIAFNPASIVAAFGAPLAIVIFLSVMATNTMVVYSMTTSVVNARIGSRLRFLPTALVLGLISIIGSTWLGLLGQFTDFLVVIGAFFIPVFAIMICDYYVVKRMSYNADILSARGGRYWYMSGVNWIGVTAWVIGAAASYIWTYVWPTPLGVSIPAFVLTFVVYLVAMLPERSRSPREVSAHLAA